MAIKLERLRDAAARLGVYWWQVPSRERFTGATLPPDLAALVSTNGKVFPLPKHKGNIPAFVIGKGPNSGGALGYKRGEGARTHAGVDLFGSRVERWDVKAVADGQIVNFYWFLNGTFALVVNHGSFVVNYGEVWRGSLEKLGLKTPKFIDGTPEGVASGKSHKRLITTSSESPPDFVAATGSNVKAGQQIGFLGFHPGRSSMLHFEAYLSGTTSQSWKGFPNASPPSRLLDPTSFLITLKGTKQPTKEVLKPPIHLGT